jgi:hypothetical protein
MWKLNRHGDMSSQQEFATTEKTCSAINSHFTFATGPVRLLMIRSTLLFEIRNPKMRMTAKAPKATTILRREFDIKGNKFKQLAIFETLLQQVGVIKQGDCNTVFGLDGKLRLMTDAEKAQYNQGQFGDQECPDCEVGTLVDNGQAQVCQNPECASVF